MILIPDPRPSRRLCPLLVKSYWSRNISGVFTWVPLARLPWCVVFCLTVWTFSAPQSNLAARVAALFVMLVCAGAMVFKPTDCIEFDRDKLDKTAAVEVVGVLGAVSSASC